MSEKTYIITIDQSTAGLRLDKALAICMTDISRSRTQQLITQQQVTLDGVIVDNAKKKVTMGEVYTLTVPPVVDAIPQAQHIPLDIVFEDEMLLVINKPVGLTVHPGAGNPDGTLVNALLHHCGDSLSGIGGIARPGIVHRIDKDTSGLLIVAKNDHAHRALAAQLEDRSLSRTYRAMVWGLPNPSHGTIDAPIGRDPKNRQRMCVVDNTPLVKGVPIITPPACGGGRGGESPSDGSIDGSSRVAVPPLTSPPQAGGIKSKNAKDAITHYQLIEAYGTLVSLVECKLETGRTHQIRVHMKHAGHSLLGDATYGSRKRLQLQHSDEAMVTALREFPRQALHAFALEFIHPASGENMRFEREMPEDMQQLRNVCIKALR